MVITRCLVHLLCRYAAIATAVGAAKVGLVVVLLRSTGVNVLEGSEEPPTEYRALDQFSMTSVCGLKA